MNLILQALADQLTEHNPYHIWTLDNNTLTTPHWYSPLTITHNQNNTLSITHYEPNDNNPNQDHPDVEITTIIDLLDPDFLQKILQDYRIKIQA